MFIKRLVQDALRRTWPMYALMFGAIVLFAATFTLTTRVGESSEFGDIVSYPMAACWAMVMLHRITLESRATHLLPVSRRDFWLVHFWLSMVGAVAATTGVVAVSLALEANAAPELWLLCLICSVLYAGCALAANAVLPPIRPDKLTWRASLSATVWIGVFIGGIYAPISFGKFLPHAFADISSPMLNVLISAVGITIGAYVYHPPITHRPGRPNLNPVSRGTEGSGWIESRLSGLPLFFWRDARAQWMSIGILCVLALADWRFLEAKQSLTDFLNAGYALPFANLPAPEIRGGLNFALWLIIMANVSPLALSPEMRRLRTLPLSASRIAAILTAGGLRLAVEWYVLFLAIHIAVLGTLPVTLRPALFLMIAGFHALGISIRTVLRGNSFVAGFVVILGTAPAFIAWPLPDSRFGHIVFTTLCIAGASALVGSFLINRRLIRNSNRVYAARPARELPAL